MCSRSRHRLRLVASLLAVAAGGGTGCFGVDGGSEALSVKFAGIAAAGAISPTSVTVTWAPQPGYSLYSVYSSSQDSPVVQLATGSSYTISGLRPNTTYSFSVVGAAPDGNQYGAAKQVQATTWSNFLGPASARAHDSQSVTLEWSHPEGPSFQVYYAADTRPMIAGGVPPRLLAPATVTSSSTGVTVGSLNPSTTYYFMVVAKYADGTDSFANSVDGGGTLTAYYLDSNLAQRPTITTDSTITDAATPVFNLSGSLATYRTDFWLFDPLNPSGPYTPATRIASIMGNGSVAAGGPLGAGLSTVVIKVTDVFAGQATSAVLDNLEVVQALPNNGLRVVSAQTASGISPLPTITTHPVSVGPYPTFTVAGGQPGYAIKLYDPSTTPPTIVGSRVGNGEIKTDSGAPLGQGLNTLYATITYGGSSATINGIQVRVKNIDRAPVLAPSRINGGIGNQGFGRSMATGDFNCDGRPDLAVGAPFGNGAWVYYGTASGLDFSAAPSATPTGTKPLYIAAPAGWYQYISSISPAGDGVKFGLNLSVANFNGDYSDSPTRHRPCTDLAVSASGAFGYGNLGAIAIYYGAPSGLQAAGTPSGNSFTCAGDGSSACTPAYYHWATSGVPIGAANPVIPYGWNGVGHSLAAGDVDGDGYDDLLAASPFADDTQSNAGQSGLVFYWRGTPNGVSPLFQKIVMPDSAIRDAGVGVHARFGTTLAVGHFLTSPRSLAGGPADIAVGFQRLGSSEPGVSNPASQSGVVVIPGSNTAPYLAVDPATGVVQTYYKIAPAQCNSSTPPASLPAGWTIDGDNRYCAWDPGTLRAIDVNKDDYDDLVFSNPYMKVPGGGRGAVFTYFGSADPGSFATQGSQATLPLPTHTCASQPCTPGVPAGTGPQVFYRGGGIDKFGSSLGLLGDTDGDGYADLGIGAIPVLAGQGNVGTAFVYHGSPGGLTSTGAVQASPGKSVRSYFGIALAGGAWSSPTGYWDSLSGNSAYNSIAVGAPGESPATRSNGVATGSATNGNQAHGTVSLYGNASPGFAAVLGAPDTLLAPDNTRLTGLGADNAVIVGDVNGDGYAEIAVRVSVPSSYAWYDNWSEHWSLYQANQQAFVLYYGSATGPITSRIVAGTRTALVPAYAPLQPGDPLLVTNSSIRASGAGFDNDSFANLVSPAGDMNHDGYADVLTASRPYTVLFYGSSSGLIVSPTPRRIPYDPASRPSQDPTLLLSNYHLNPNPSTPGIGTLHEFRAVGDFNGDGSSDVAFRAENGHVAVIYGSDLGPVTDGEVWDAYHYGSNHSAAPDTNRAGQEANCSGSPLVCTPLVMYADLASAPGMTIAHPLPEVCVIASAGDMDGDGTDELAMSNCGDTSWNYVAGNPGNTPGVGAAGTISIYYGSKSSGIEPTRFLKLRIASRIQARSLGGWIWNYTQSYNGTTASAQDINGDGLSDLLLSSALESTGYVVYGVAGPGTSPTSTSGAYIQQGLCSSFPCTLDVSQVATADFQPNHLIDLSASVTDSCSPALRSCNVMRFTLQGGSIGNYYDGLFLFGTGDITGDGFGDVVLSESNMTVSPNGGWGSFYIYSGSPKGLQVSGTPSSKPSCQSGACDPMQFNVPVPASPSVVPGQMVVSPMRFYANGAGLGDVDGDGRNDFLIQSPNMNALDLDGNLAAGRTGGFFLFH